MPAILESAPPAQQPATAILKLTQFQVLLMAAILQCPTHTQFFPQWPHRDLLSCRWPKRIIGVMPGATRHTSWVLVFLSPDWITKLKVTAHQGWAVGTRPSLPGLFTRPDGDFLQLPSFPSTFPRPHISTQASAVDSATSGPALFAAGSILRALGFTKLSCGDHGP